MIKRIGILTGGGDCPGLNAVISALVRSGIPQGYEFIGFKKGFEGLLNGGDYIKLDLEAVRGIAHLGGTILKTTNKGHFSGKIGSGQERAIDLQILNEAKETLEKLEIGCLVVIGGDGTLSTAYQFYQQGIPVVGVPKTIDNDLQVTDQTFGFSTGVEIITEAMGRLHTTASSHDRVLLVETMGRHAGWLTLYGGIAGGADMILIPEIPFSSQAVVDFLRQRQSHGRFYAVIAVAEGAMAEGEGQVYQSESADKENLLGGVAHQIAQKINQLAPNEFETRVVILGHLQRGGEPNAQDKILSARFGFGAFQAVENQQFGKMVTLSGTEIRLVPIQDAISHLKRVDPSSDIVQMAKSIGISFGEK